MAKDYFQDIIPPAGEPIQPRQFPQSAPAPSDGQDADVRDIPIRVADTSDQQESADVTSRGIRSISPPTRVRPPRVTGAPINMDQDIRGPYGGSGTSRRSTRLWIWAAASLFVLVGATLLLFVFASTTITVTPKSRSATLTASTLTAHQVETAADATPGTLSYTTQTFDLEDSDVVASKGTTHVESKASGSITVYNSYSATPVKLVKTTRFETPDGLIFRALSDIVVPGKVGSTPGQVKVTVAADQPGEKYNIGPTAKFTLPGLKSTAPMYSGVYAKSIAAFTGGFAGEQAGAEPGALESAVALLRTKLETKAREAAVAQAKEGTSVFPGLIEITYESLPNTTEAGDSVRIHEKARVSVPVFPSDAFAEALMHSAFSDVTDAPVSIKPSEDFSVRPAESGGEAQPGVLNIAVSGGVLFVWNTDTEALAKDLAGKDSSAFQTIVNTYASIQEAHARITPFWKSTFPTDPADIKMEVLVPETGK